MMSQPSLKDRHENVGFQIDMQTGKNAQTFHIGSIQKIGIVVLKQIIHCIADPVL